MLKNISLKVFVFIIILFSIFRPYCLAEENNGPQVISLSLNDAISIAYKNNKEIQIQEEEVKAARSDIMAARSELLPKLNADASYTHNGDVLRSTSSSAGTKKDQGLFSGYKNDNQVGLSITDTVYNGGANITKLRQSKIKLTIQEETLRAYKLNVEFETKRLYYGLLLAYETLRITENLVTQAQAHYEDVKSKFDQGASSRFDVLQSKVQVSKLIPELIKARNSVDLINVELKKVLGINMFDTITVTGKLDYSVLEIKESQFLKEAYLNNPTMFLKVLGVDVSKLGIKVARASGLPQIDAELDYYYRSNNWNNMFNSRHNNWSAGIKISMPIFDGFSTKAKVEQAKAKYAESILEKENLADQIVVDIKQACLDLRQAQAIIDSQKDNIQEAREALRISNIAYDNGVGINLDVLDSQVSLSQIEKNLAEGIYDYLMAGAFLDKTMGNEGAKS